MKTIMKFTVAIAFMFTTMVSNAKEPKLSVISENETKSLVFELDSKFKETTVQFKNADDYVMYTEKVSDEVYIKKFNLKELEDGVYYFLAEDTFKSLVYKISLKGDEVKIIDKKENAKPIFRSKNDMVFLNLLNLDKDKVQIKVIDSENRIVFTENLKDRILVEKAFNFKTAYKDNYIIVVKNGNDTYFERVVVN